MADVLLGGINFNLTVLALNDPGARLDFGMTCGEARRRACNWWNNIGSREVRLNLIRQSEPVGSANKGNGAAFASPDPDSPNFLRSGILLGFLWESLTAAEQAHVTATWAEFHGRAAWEREKPFRWGNKLPVPE